MNQVKLKIEGMACGMCEAHINDVIRETVPKAKKVTSSHKKGEAGFLVDGDVDLELLKEKIGATGYRCTDAVIEPYQKKGLFK